MRSFILGAASGALVFAVASWLLADKIQDRKLAAPVAEVESGVARSTPDPASGLESVEKATPEDKLGVEERRDPELFEAYEDQSETAAREDALDPSSGWMNSAYDRLVAEPKDNEWSYYMEQTILQFLAGHPSLSDFEISYIECRTTRCQIKVAGYAESTGPTWNRIMYELSEQPWDEFGQRGNSSRIIDGRLVIIQDLHRR